MQIALDFGGAAAADAHRRAAAGFEHLIDFGAADVAAVTLRPSGDALLQRGGFQIVFAVGVAKGRQPQIAAVVHVQRRHFVHHRCRRAGSDGFGKLQRVGRLHAHAAVAAHTGHAGRIAGAVDAETEFGLAQTHEHRPQRIARAGRNAGYAVAALALDGFGNVPGRIKSLGADAVLAEHGLGVRLAHRHRISLLQLAVGIQKQPLLRDVDNNVPALGGRRNVGNGGGLGGQRGLAGSQRQQADKQFVHLAWGTRTTKIKDAHHTVKPPPASAFVRAPPAAPGGGKQPENGQTARQPRATRRRQAAA